MTCNLAICDDEPIILSEIERRVKKALTGFNLQPSIYTYTSGEDLITDFENGIDFDLVILDLSLKGIDGLETAKQLKEKSKSIMIVFCTGYDPYPELFKVHPYGFLYKGFSEEKMNREIVDILQELENSRKNGQFVLFDGNEAKNIFIRDIVCVEGTKRGSTLLVTDKKTGEESRVLIKESLEEIWNQYPELIRIHKSYLVNVHHIVSNKMNKVLLHDGKVLSVSRSYRNEATKAIFDNIIKKH